MSIVEWITSQSGTTKLLIGISIGIVLYVGLRTLIHFANKDAKQISMTAKQLTHEENLKALAEGH